jgi:predicted membrane chloride channel (bestrophin family)
MMVAIWESFRRLFPPLKVRAKLWPMMLLLAVYGMLVSKAIEYERLPKIEWGAESTVVNGLALSFLIGFRNNHAYDRWWEARMLWASSSTKIAIFA